MYVKSYMLFIISPWEIALFHDSISVTPQSGVPSCWLTDAMMSSRPLFILMLAFDDLVQLIQFLVLIW